jgi:formate hydrogenlyase transcriptional activator
VFDERQLTQRHPRPAPRAAAMFSGAEKSNMTGALASSANDLYGAVLALSRSIAGRHDLQDLVAGVAESVQRIVTFDHLALVLHDPNENVMHGHILNSAGNPVTSSLRMQVDEDPAGWVWLNQKPLVIPNLRCESRWPAFVKRTAEYGLTTLVLLPLTSGENRLGAFGFSSVAPHEPTAAEMTFLERVASEFAVAVESFLAKQSATRERDRLRILFDITNALVSKLSPDELFSAISDQLSKVIKHDHAILTLRAEESGILEVYALHSSDPNLLEVVKGPFNPEGMPAGEVFATGKAVIAREDDIDRYPNPAFRNLVELGLKSICSVPLITRARIIGTLALSRVTDDTWVREDVELLVQVAKQIAIAVDNSLSFRQLTEMKERLATEKLYLEDEICLDNNLRNMLGEGAAFQAVLNSIQIVAPTDSSVLILGETGTGKELVARAIHELSARKKGSFVKVNCAAIPGSLLESELFGHEKGSFTGAIAQKIGRFELAHGGTLLLDEIGEMPLELQPKLLRAIQDQEFERVGGTRTIRTDVRFVAATNRDLKAMVDENKFRADLYYRLHVFPIHVPPLRERREDIPLLTRYFVQKHAQRMGRKIETIPTAALEALVRYDWPGNIRELQNLLERSVILTKGSTLHLAVPDGSAQASSHRRTGGFSRDAERDRILKALEEAKGQVGGPNGAAARLGLKRTTLQARMQKYNIARQYR